MLCNYLQNVAAITYIFVLQLSTFLFYNKQPMEILGWIVFVVAGLIILAVGKICERYFMFAFGKRNTGCQTPGTNNL